MRMIFNKVLYSCSERREKIPEIYQNIHDSIIQLVLQMEPLGLRFGSLTTERSANYILSLPAEAPEYFNEVSDVTTNGHRERLCPGILSSARHLRCFHCCFASWGV